VQQGLVAILLTSETNSFLCQNATNFLEKVLRRFVRGSKSSFGRFFDLVQITLIKEAGEELKE